MEYSIMLERLNLELSNTIRQVQKNAFRETSFHRFTQIANLFSLQMMKQIMKRHLLLKVQLLILNPIKWLSNLMAIMIGMILLAVLQEQLLLSVKKTRRLLVAVLLKQLLLSMKQTSLWVKKY